DLADAPTLLIVLGRPGHGADRALAMCRSNRQEEGSGTCLASMRRGDVCSAELSPVLFLSASLCLDTLQSTGHGIPPCRVVGPARTESFRVHRCCVLFLAVRIQLPSMNPTMPMRAPT